MSESGKTVCVTGASGYIASWIVKLLLQRGYTVHATVRDPSDSKKTEHLRALDGSSERLQLLKADLLEEGSFDSIIEGCDGVFHTASPVNFRVTDPQAELFDPAIKGTLNILKSCLKNPSLKRVVLTSSIATVANTANSRDPDVIVDETFFSDPEICKQSQSWYSLSKTLAEEAAWKFSKENGIDMVTINPGMVIGPLLQPTINSSCAQIFNLINGSTFPNSSFGWINVKDVAMAHILAYEILSANGRYLAAERVLHYSAIVEIMRELYPSFQLPDKCANDKPLIRDYRLSTEKVKSLGLENYIPFEISLQETIQSFKEKGFLA